MFKRIGLFLLTNIMMVVMIGIIANLLGIQPYLTANGIDFGSLLAICLLWGFGGSFISLAMSKFMAKRFMGIQLIDQRDPQVGWVVSRTHEYARKAGITKMPEVGIYNSPEVNAFATGPSKNSSLIAVSTGLLESMSQEEVEGVLGHEVAHAANGDMVTMALVQGVVNAFVMFLSRAIAFVISQAMRGDDEEGGGVGGLAHFGIVMVLDLVLGFLAMPIVMWFSRFREYRADAGGAKLAGKEKMIAGLERLRRTHELIAPDEGNLATMKISGKSKFSELFSSHPPLEKRIKALQSARL